MASTWNGTAGNQLVTIAAWNNFQPSTPISGTSTKIITKAMICAAVGSAGYCTNNPIASMPSTQCPTKDSILATQ
jgi:hypothetical protein